MKKPTKCRTGVLSQSGASIFAALPIRSKLFCPRGKENEEKLPSVTTNRHSKKICPLYYIVVVIVDGQFDAYALKIYI